MKVLMIINGSAYGVDSTYNAVRLAESTMEALTDATLAADKAVTDVREALAQQGFGCAETSPIAIWSCSILK